MGFLIVQAGLKLLKQLKKNAMGYGLLVAAFGLMLATDLFGLPISSIVLMVGGALIGLGVYAAKRGGEAK